MPVLLGVVDILVFWVPLVPFILVLPFIRPLVRPFVVPLFMVPLFIVPFCIRSVPVPVWGGVVILPLFMVPLEVPLFMVPLGVVWAKAAVLKQSAQAVTAKNLMVFMTGVKLGVEKEQTAVATAAIMHSIRHLALVVLPIYKLFFLSRNISCTISYDNLITYYLYPWLHQSPAASKWQSGFV